MFDLHALRILILEGQERTDGFLAFAAGQEARIDLEVPCFNIVSILGNEGERDLHPLGVRPLGSDDNWHEREAFRVDGLDEKVEAFGRLGFEVVYCDGDGGHPCKRVGQTIVVALAIFRVGEGDQTSVKCRNYPG